MPSAFHQKEQIASSSSETNLSHIFFGEKKGRCKAAYQSALYNRKSGNFVDDS